jgi:hypothetical protein
VAVVPGDGRVTVRRKLPSTVASLAHLGGLLASGLRTMGEARRPRSQSRVNSTRGLLERRGGENSKLVPARVFNDEIGVLGFGIYGSKSSILSAIRTATHSCDKFYLYPRFH